jgi:hypothetical protein
MRYLFIICSLVMLANCADTTQLIKSGNESFKLLPENRIYVSIPSDGRYGSKNYPGSGRTVSQLIMTSFSKHTANIKVGNDVQSNVQAIAYSKTNNYDFLILPTILAWEDRATEWSGIPDQVSVKIEVIHAASGKSMSSGIIHGKSGISTLGGDHPQDLLSDPIKEYADSIY